MRILIEEYQYNAADVKEVISGIDALENIEGKVSIHYVGYYYNPQLKDCVFILPKVLLEGENGQELVFGKYSPESIIDLDTNNPLSKDEYFFVYEFAVWIYRSIVVFKESRTDSGIVYHKQIAKVGKGSHRLSNTFLDILLEIIRFNHENKNFFFFVLRNIHSGINKINWNRTISTTNANIQDQNPVYLNPVNKKQQINFDEELLVIFFSILNYIGDTYGFPKNIDCNFDLIKGRQFETYLKGLGRNRLLLIKYKYFSDKALELWNLCYAFFDRAKEISISAEQKEYLLVKNYNIVFEAIIDELLGDNPLPDDMERKQEDGKIIDHLFTAKSLIENNNNTYYIGDSKYYKIGHRLGPESIYKQYTYARNVIQWNLDIFNNSDKEPESGVKLRDDLTEGYNIIPNFFISSKIDKNHLNYGDDNIIKRNEDNTQNRHHKEHFKNRLFDRDSLLLFHYDVNFLFIISLYARNNTLQKSDWKNKMREKFREDIQNWLQEDYEFYTMEVRGDLTLEKAVEKHFKKLNGKIYKPSDCGNMLIMALDKNEKYKFENTFLLSQLKEDFDIREYHLTSSFKETMAKIVSRIGKNPQKHFEYPDPDSGVAVAAEPEAEYKATATTQDNSPK